MPRPDLDPVLEMDFNIDLNKIESLITSLNKKEFLNKFTLRRNTCTGQNRNVTG